MNIKLDAIGGDGYKIGLETVHRPAPAGKIPHDGIPAADYQRVQQWIADGCPKTPDTAFTSGVARDAARLVAEAVRPDMPDAFDKGWARGYQASTRNYANGMKAASAMLGVTRQDIRLACGEMTAQEMRTVLVVLEWRRAAIVRKAEEA